MTLADVVIVGLAAFRLAMLLVVEDGPFDMFVAIRRLVGAEKAGKLSMLAKMFTCVWCMGIWTTVLMGGLWHLHELPVQLMAAAGLVVFIHMVGEKATD